MKKRLIKIITSCLIFGVIVTGGYFAYAKYTGTKTVSAAIKYTTVKATKTNLQVSVQGAGAVYASVIRDVVANNSGELKDLVLKEGDMIKKGDKVAQVYNSQLQDQIDKADLSLKKQNLQSGNAKTDADAQIQKLTTTQAEKDLNTAIAARDKMTITSPLDGLVVTKSANNGDTLQSGKPIISVVDTTSYKIKVSIDELDISKIKNGQKAEIKFDALVGKTYEGAVESIAQLGDTSNNATTYGVVISIKDLSGIKLGMNANVNILIESKENVLAVPVEAIIERNGINYVMVPGDESSVNKTSKDTSKTQSDTSTSQPPAASTQMGNMTQEQRTEFLKNNPDMAKRFSQRQSSGTNTNSSSNGAQATSGNLIKVETGMENEKYIEILSGITEGQSVQIALPNTSTNSSLRSGTTGMSGGLNGNFPGRSTSIPKR